MKTKIKLLFVPTILTLSAMLAFIACNRDGKGIYQEDNELIGQSLIPNVTSTYWNDAYRQHQINGNVKTVKTMEEGNNRDRFDLLEFDIKGNLLKEYRNKDKNDGELLTMSYDEKNRLTKVVYGNYSKPEIEVAEFAYDGSHTAYIPTNIYSLEDWRLQKGVSSIKYTLENKPPMEINCTSVSGNRVVFEGKAGGLASILGNITHAEAEYDGNYPIYINFRNLVKVYSGASIKLGEDGIPEKVIYHLNTGESMVTEYTTIAGFLLITKQYETSTPDDFKMYRYNEKGYVEYVLDMSVAKEYSYSYVYDGHGNWIKRIQKTKKSINTNLEEYPITEIREYTYWN